MTKNILITGCNGQLGTEMRNLLTGNPRYNAWFTDVAQLDITDGEAIDHFMDQHPVDYLVNCAAFTAVDRAEEQQDLCRRLNATAVELLGRAAQRHGTRMVQISTDYVFNGNACTPLTEDQQPAPQSTYGRTKLEGEQLLLQAAPESVILRTAWLYSPYGHNFVKTMLNLGRTHKQLTVVFDQLGTPTYALDLARAILTVIEAPEWHAGTYHFSDEGAISWYDFTKAIHRLGGISGCDVQPVTSDQYPTAATRPHYSVFNKDKFKRTFGVTIPYWEDSLRDCIARLNSTNQ